MAQNPLFLIFWATLKFKSRLQPRSSKLCANKGCGAIGVSQGMGCLDIYAKIRNGMALPAAGGRGEVV